MEVALGIASVVYGGLLGGFALARLSRRADQRSAILGMTTGIGVVLIVQQGGAVAWPWFVLIGALVTFAVGHLLGRGGETP